MSSITKEWTEDKIRWIIRNLDSKTGLNGAELPIVLANHAGALGCYQFKDGEQFWYKPSFMNDDSTPEAAIVDLIRHEYAHYYVRAARLDRYIGHNKRETSHGKDWRWACKMVGAIPERCYDPETFKDVNWSVEKAESAYKAEDVVAFDIIAYINKWGQAPTRDKAFAAKMLNSLKVQHPDDYYEVGEQVYHPQFGQGIVLETIPCNYWTQKMYVQFEDNTTGVYTARAICKIVNGVAVRSFNNTVKASEPKAVKPAQLSMEELFPSLFEN